MRILGKVKNGVVVLPRDAGLEEGQLVEIALAEMPGKDSVVREAALPYTRVADLPDDIAMNHDYYLHGHGKQKPRRGRWLPPDRHAPDMTERAAAEFTDKLISLASETVNLPPDLSAEHNHYLHGQPKE